MKDPNKPYDWNDIKKDIEDQIPSERDFGNNDPYSDEEVTRDLTKINQIKSDPNYKTEVGLNDSKIQEYATAMEIGEMDWFGEELSHDILFPDDKGANTIVFMTSEFDDHINHADIVCVANNSFSNFEPLPFALDLTYNTDEDGLDKKFSWLHPSKDINLPGFCTIKYLEDTFSYKPAFEKGRIEVMPRFVIGFNPELAEQITKERMSNNPWGSLSRIEPSTKAKFCVLKELKNESEQMLKYLSEHKNGNQNLENLHKQVEALDKYFDNALEVARANDSHNFEGYSNRDEVASAILSRKII